MVRMVFRKNYSLPKKNHPYGIYFEEHSTTECILKYKMLIDRNSRCSKINSTVTIH